MIFRKAAERPIKATRLELDSYVGTAQSLARRGDVSKKMAAQRAENTLKLIKEKYRRWSDEDKILREEAQSLESLRQQQLQRERERVAMAQTVVQEEKQRMAIELTRQQQNMERQRMSSIQWGRNFVQPMQLIHATPPPMQAAPPLPTEGAPPPPSGGSSTRGGPPMWG